MDSVLRSVLCEIGGIDQAVTEFIRITGTLLPEHVFYKYSPELQNGGVIKTNRHDSTGLPASVPVFIQLLGSNLTTMSENAARAAELGAPGIDLNFGCPAKSVNRHDGGAVLLKTPQRVFEIIEAVRKAVPQSVPVTAKVRLGFDTKELCEEIAQAVQAGGASWITIHARTKTDGYIPPAYWEFIPRMQKHLKIPIVANGEVWGVDDFKRGCLVSGIDSHWALGRGLVGRPDLGLQIKNLTENSILEFNQLLNYVDLFLERSLQKETQNPGAFALARIKQWFKYLSRGYPEAADLFEVLKRADHIMKVSAIIEDYKTTHQNQDFADKDDQCSIGSDT